MALDRNPLFTCRPQQPPKALRERVLAAASRAVPEAEQACPLLGKTEWGLLAATLVLCALFVASSYPRRTQPPPLHGTYLNLNHYTVQALREIGVPPEDFRCIQRERHDNQRLLEEIGG